MFPQKKLALFVGLVVSGGLTSLATAQQTTPAELDIVYVTENQDDATTEGTGSYTTTRTDSATRLNLSPKQTPQSVSVVTRSKMDDFSQNSVNDVLSGATGVNVERIETDRTVYTARGFDITNFQVDGIGLPMTFGIAEGEIDTAIFDRVDVVKGANGLMNGAGNPSATVNMIRKRPTQEFQSAVTGSIGSWNNQRIEGDVSGALVDSGKVRGRVVMVNQGKDSYLDRYGLDKNVFYSIFDADLNDSTVLTLGFSYQTSNANSPMWGGLPLSYSDGTQTNYDVSTSTATDWAYWDNQEERAFAELSHEFANHWKTKAVLTHIANEQDSRLFYAYGTPDRTDESGLKAYPSAYLLDRQQNIIDVYATGPFSLAGREHELVAGGSFAKAQTRERSDYSADIGTAIDGLDRWDGSYAEPDFTAFSNSARFNDKQLSGYLASRFSLTDDLALITGGRISSWDTEGSSYGEDKRSSAHGNVTPYTGLVYDLNKNYAVYASYAGIFTPQNKSDINGERLKPIDGDSYETGVKGEFFDKKLNTTVAVFKTKQNNVAQQAGVKGTQVYYEGVDGLRSQGYEFDIAGEILDELESSVGFTHVDIDNSDGSVANTYTPRNLFKVSVAYKINKWKVGAGVNWQDDIYRTDNGVTVEQESYALLNLMAKYDFTKQLSAGLNVYNVTNEKYINSLYWSQGHYGAPRNAMLSVSWKY